MAQLWVHSSEGLAAALLSLSFLHPSSSPAQANFPNNRGTRDLLGPSLGTGTLFLLLLPNGKSQARSLYRCLICAHLKTDATPRTHVSLTGVVGRPHSDTRPTVTLGTH